MFAILLNCVRPPGKRYLKPWYSQLRQDTPNGDSPVAKFAQLYELLKTQTFRRVHLATGTGSSPFSMVELVLLHMYDQIPEGDQTVASAPINAAMSVLRGIRRLLNKEKAEVERAARGIYHMFGFHGINLALSPVVSNLFSGFETPG